MGGWGTPASTSEHDHHTVRKREQLLRCPRTRLVPHASVAAVVAVGSVAADLARADPDIDAVVFMDPLDLHVAPRRRSGVRRTTRTARSSRPTPASTTSSST